MVARSIRPLKVCIVGLKCYDHIAKNPTPRYLGGIETQLAVLARGLVKEGCEVTLITYDHGQTDGEYFDGVKVFKSYRPEEGIPMLRWVHPRATLLWKAMKQADADIYLQMGAGSETGLVALASRLCGYSSRHFVFCLASDADCFGPLDPGPCGLEKILYRYGIRRADLVIAQTSSQKEKLRQTMEIEAEVVSMAAEPRNGDASPPSDNSTRVLWIGRITPGKRLEWLLEAGRRCPEVSFDVVGTSNKKSEYANRLTNEAALIPNVTVHGRLPESELSRVYQTSRLLCCTSELEGFPTTFLEAWSCGIPVVTTFDPDGIIARNGLGLVAGGLSDLITNIQALLGNREAYSQMSQAAKRYYSENHTIKAVAQRFRRALEGMSVRHLG